MASGAAAQTTWYVDDDGMPRLNILEVQRLIRFMPKVVIAVVPGWAVGIAGRIRESRIPRLDDTRGRADRAVPTRPSRAWHDHPEGGLAFDANRW